MKTDDLFDLVRSCSPTEKKLFRHHLAHHKRVAMDTLFVAVNALDEWDDQTLRASLKGHSMLSQLSVAKYDLRTELTRWLARRTTDTYGMLLDDVRAVRMLIDRGLTTQAHSLLDTVIRKAESEELYAHRMLAHPLEWQLNSMQGADAMLFEEQRMEAEQRLADTLHRLSTLSTVNLSISKRLHAAGWMPDPSDTIRPALANELLHHPLLQDYSPKHDGIRTGIYVATAMATIHGWLGNTQEHVSWRERALEFCLQNPSLTTPETIVGLIHNLCNSYIHAARTKDIPPLLDTLEALPTTIRRTNAAALHMRILETVGSFRTVLAMDGNADQWHLVTSRLLPFLLDGAPGMRLRYRHLLLVQSAAAAIRHHRPDLAQQCCARYLRLEEPTDVADYPVMIHLLNAASYLEDGPTPVSRAALRAAERAIAALEPRPPAISAALECITLLYRSRLPPSVMERIHVALATMATPSAHTGMNALHAALHHYHEQQQRR